ACREAVVRGPVAGRAVEGEAGDVPPLAIAAAPAAAKADAADGVGAGAGAGNPVAAHALRRAVAAVAAGEEPAARLDHDVSGHQDDRRVGPQEPHRHAVPDVE